MSLSYWEYKSWFTDVDFTVIGETVVDFADIDGVIGESSKRGKSFERAVEWSGVNAPLFSLFCVSFSFLSLGNIAELTMFSEGERLFFACCV